MQIPVLKAPVASLCLSICGLCVSLYVRACMPHTDNILASIVKIRRLPLSVSVCVSLSPCLSLSHSLSLGSIV